MPLSVVYRGGDVDFSFQRWLLCKDCSGDGYGECGFETCSGCAGKGGRLHWRTTSVRIFPGMQDGDRIRVAGEGDEPRHIARARDALARVGGMLRGDVFASVAVVPEKGFRRDRDDLHLDCEVSLAVALGGGALAVEHLDGRAVPVHVLPGDVLQPGSTLRIVGEGMPRPESPAERGALVVHFAVAFPATLPESAASIVRTALPEIAAILRTAQQGDRWRAGDDVSYFSGTFGKWLPARIARVRQEGALNEKIEVAYFAEGREYFNREASTCNIRRVR